MASKYDVYMNFRNYLTSFAKEGSSIMTATRDASGNENYVFRPQVSAEYQRTVDLLEQLDNEELEKVTTYTAEEISEARRVMGEIFRNHTRPFTDEELSTRFKAEMLRPVAESVKDPFESRYTSVTRGILIRKYFGDTMGVGLSGPEFAKRYRRFKMHLERLSKVNNIIHGACINDAGYHKYLEANKVNTKGDKKLTKALKKGEKQIKKVNKELNSKHSIRNFFTTNKMVRIINGWDPIPDEYMAKAIDSMIAAYEALEQTPASAVVEETHAPIPEAGPTPDPRPTHETGPVYEAVEDVEAEEIPVGGDGTPTSDPSPAPTPEAVPADPAHPIPEGARTFVVRTDDGRYEVIPYEINSDTNEIVRIEADPTFKTESELNSEERAQVQLGIANIEIETMDGEGHVIVQPVQHVIDPSVLSAATEYGETTPIARQLEDFSFEYDYAKIKGLKMPKDKTYMAAAYEVAAIPEGTREQQEYESIRRHQYVEMYRGYINDTDSSVADSVKTVIESNSSAYATYSSDEGRAFDSELAARFGYFYEVRESNRPTAIVVPAEDQAKSPEQWKKPKKVYISCDKDGKNVKYVEYIEKDGHFLVSEEKTDSSITLSKKQISEVEAMTESGQLKLVGATETVSFVQGGMVNGQYTYQPYREFKQTTTYLASVILGNEFEEFRSGSGKNIIDASKDFLYGDAVSSKDAKRRREIVEDYREYRDDKERQKEVETIIRKHRKLFKDFEKEHPDMGENLLRYSFLKQKELEITMEDLVESHKKAKNKTTLIDGKDTGFIYDGKTPLEYGGQKFSLIGETIVGIDPATNKPIVRNIYENSKFPGLVVMGDAKPSTRDFATFNEFAEFRAKTGMLSVYSRALDRNVEYVSVPGEDGSRFVTLDEFKQASYMENGDATTNGKNYLLSQAYQDRFRDYVDANPGKTYAELVTEFGKEVIPFTKEEEKAIRETETQRIRTENPEMTSEELNKAVDDRFQQYVDTRRSQIDEIYAQYEEYTLRNGEKEIDKTVNDAVTSIDFNKFKNQHGYTDEKLARFVYAMTKTDYYAVDPDIATYEELETESPEVIAEQLEAKRQEQIRIDRLVKEHKDLFKQYRDANPNMDPETLRSSFVTEMASEIEAENLSREAEAQRRANVEHMKDAMKARYETSPTVVIADDSALLDVEKGDYGSQRDLEVDGHSFTLRGKFSTSYTEVPVVDVNGQPVMGEDGQPKTYFVARERRYYEDPKKPGFFILGNEITTNYVLTDEEKAQIDNGVLPFISRDSRGKERDFKGNEWWKTLKVTTIEGFRSGEQLVTMQTLKELNKKFPATISSDEILAQKRAELEAQRAQELTNDSVVEEVVTEQVKSPEELELEAKRQEQIRIDRLVKEHKDLFKQYRDANPNMDPETLRSSFVTEKAAEIEAETQRWANEENMKEAFKKDYAAVPLVVIADDQEALNIESGTYTGRTIVVDGQSFTSTGKMNTGYLEVPVVGRDGQPVMGEDGKPKTKFVAKERVFYENPDKPGLFILGNELTTNNEITPEEMEMVDKGNVKLYSHYKGRSREIIAGTGLNIVKATSLDDFRHQKQPIEVIQTKTLQNEDKFGPVISANEIIEEKRTELAAQREREAVAQAKAAAEAAVEPQISARPEKISAFDRLKSGIRAVFGSQKNSVVGRIKNPGKIVKYAGLSAAVAFGVYAAKPPVTVSAETLHKETRSEFVINSDKLESEIEAEQLFDELGVKVAPRKNENEAYLDAIEREEEEDSLIASEEAIIAENSVDEEMVQDNEGDKPKVEMPSGIYDLAADALWDDIYKTLSSDKMMQNGQPVIGSVVMDILRVASNREPIESEDKRKARIKEILTRTYSNHTLKTLLENGLNDENINQEIIGLGVDIEKCKINGKVNPRLLAGAIAEAKYNSIADTNTTDRGWCRLALRELSKAKYNGYNVDENGVVQQDGRQDSKFYRALVQNNIVFSTEKYQELIKEEIDKQINPVELTNPEQPIVELETPIGPMEAVQMEINGVVVYVDKTKNPPQVIETDKIEQNLPEGQTPLVDLDKIVESVNAERAKTTAYDKNSARSKEDDSMGIK